MRHGWGDRPKDQRDTVRPEIDPQKCDQGIFDKGAKIIQWRRDKLFSKGVGTISHPHPKR